MFIDSWPNGLRCSDTLLIGLVIGIGPILHFLGNIGISNDCIDNSTNNYACALCSHVQVQWFSCEDRMASKGKKSPIWESERIQSLLLAVFVGRRFREAGQAQKLTTLRTLSAISKCNTVLRITEKQKQKSLEPQEDQPMTSAKVKQLTIKKSRERTQVWDSNVSWAHHIHRWIRELIAIDCQPFSIVQNGGFTTHLNTLEPRYTSQRRYTSLNSGLLDRRVEKSNCWCLMFSFTTHIWSTDLTTLSLTSLHTG